jgi:hypothetical protein
LTLSLLRTVLSIRSSLCQSLGSTYPLLTRPASLLFLFVQFKVSTRLDIVDILRLVGFADDLHLDHSSAGLIQRSIPIPPCLSLSILLLLVPSPLLLIRWPPPSTIADPRIIGLGSREDCSCGSCPPPTQFDPKNHRNCFPPHSTTSATSNHYPRPFDPCRIPSSSFLFSHFYLPSSSALSLLPSIHLHLLPTCAISLRNPPFVCHRHPGPSPRISTGSSLHEGGDAGPSTFPRSSPPFPSTLWIRTAVILFVDFLALHPS